MVGDALTVAGPAPKRIAKPDGAMMLVCVESVCVDGSRDRMYN